MRPKHGRRPADPRGAEERKGSAIRLEAGRADGSVDTGVQVSAHARSVFREISAEMGWQEDVITRHRQLRRLVMLFAGVLHELA